MQKIKYEPEICDHCGQTKTYLLGLDHGTADIVVAIAKKIGQKGINIVHPRKEMEGLVLSSNQVGNLSRARFHGLIAHVKNKKGNYLLTRKGASFLRGETIPRFAIVSKAEGHQVGYFKEDILTTTIRELLQGEYWEGINYDIVEGEVFHRLPGKEKETPLF